MVMRGAIRGSWNQGGFDDRDVCARKKCLE